MNSNFVIFVSALLLVVVISFALSFPVYLLWNNCLVGAVSGVQTVTWLQSWGIAVLFNFLSGSNRIVKN